MIPEKLRAALDRRPGGWGRELHLAEVATSTNDDARQAALEGAAEGAVFVADRQTAGRGRAGRAWFSPAGQNVYLSVLLRPPIPVEQLAPLPLVVGLAVAETLAGLVEPPVRVKWPNDLWIEGRKVGGILVESTVRARAVSAVIGVGVNVATQRFPEDSTFSTSATSLVLEGANVDRVDLIADLVRAFEAHVQTFYERGLSSFLPALRARDALLGRRVGGGSVEGVARGLADDGRLLVERADGTTVVVAAGEVRLLPSTAP